MEKQRYEHQRIERKWQQIWEEQKLFKAVVDRSKPKYYILDMFPYPSGAGLHVGHVTGYTATDILARYKRQKGFNVLHPMGWDSFGLPAEQYAVRTGTHPAITTEKNINTYRRQLKSLGFSYDWEREIATSDPSYYKWTQWIFTKLYEKGLAYEAEVQVNFCPALGTVLANEEIENGFSKEGGYAIERRPLRQWILKITAYAERLLEDLDLLDWPDHLKKLQTNWIGKSIGAKILFKVEDTQEEISIFTTCSDTIFGVSYVVLAPEHPLVGSLIKPAQKEAVESFLEEVSSKSDLERTELGKEKNGVFTGSYALNPVNNKRIPIWIADYVLASYGTGAVMGVPSHDERDFAFAKKYHLPIQAVILPYEEEVREASIDDPFELIKEEVLAHRRCWIGTGTIINSSSSFLTIDGLDNISAKEAVIAWLAKNAKGEKCVNYKLRDWLFSRQRYWGEPFPILHFADGSKRVLDVDELPLTPPQLTNYKPCGTGESPLANALDWIEIIDPKTGKKARREANTMPQWAGSCWYYLRFCDPLNEKKAWGKEEENYWMPVDMYVGGIEHAVLHLLYSRFWHKVLFDLGLVSTKEPFQTLRNQGLVTSRSYQMPSGSYVDPQEVKEKEGKYFHLGSNEELKSQIEKMSKSKLNGVTPDVMIEEFGADALRLYEMFMGPFDKEKVWNTDSVTGCRRFLSRFYDVVHSEKVCDGEDLAGMKLCHKVVAAVEKDIESMQYNTAIAKMMEFLNAFQELKTYPKKGLKMVVQALYAFAPHITEECWQDLGERESLTFIPFPTVDPAMLIDSTVTYVVQINGKTRSSFELEKDKSKEEILAYARAQPVIAKYLEKGVRKVIFVPNKLLNVVVDG